VHCFKANFESFPVPACLSLILQYLTDKVDLQGFGTGLAAKALDLDASRHRDQLLRKMKDQLPPCKDHQTCQADIH
jgi:hypothetical protein